jgi:predicted RNA-binding protein with PUA-like domain
MAKTPACYLVKSEPSVYSFAQLCRDGQTRWDGVRNYEARNNLRAMRVGDRLLFYHSNEGKQIVGVARVTKAAYPDPTAPGEDWSVVEVAPVVALHQPVTLAAIKAEPRLAEMALVRKSRISVVPVTAAEFALVLRLGATKLPAAGRSAAAASSTAAVAGKVKSAVRPTAKGRATARAAGRRSIDAAQ